MLLYAGIVEPAVLLSTITIVMVHVAEWADGVFRQNGFASSKILKGGLGIETFDYFSLLIVWTVFFPNRLIFLTLIAFLGIVHLTAFQMAISQRLEEWLGHNRSRNVALMGFDVIGCFGCSILSSCTAVINQTILC